MPAPGCRCSLTSGATIMNETECISHLTVMKYLNQRKLVGERVYLGLQFLKTMPIHRRRETSQRGSRKLEHHIFIHTKKAEGTQGLLIPSPHILPSDKLLSAWWYLLKGPGSLQTVPPAVTRCLNIRPYRDDSHSKNHPGLCQKRDTPGMAA